MEDDWKEMVNRVVEGDSAELLKRLPDGCADMVMTSPPYDGMRTYGGTLEWDFDVFRAIAGELARVLAPGGVIVWVVGDMVVDGGETCSSFRQALHFTDCLGLRLHDTMLYLKKGGMQKGSHYSYRQMFEYMFVFSKGRPKSIHLIRDRKFDFDSMKEGEEQNTVRRADGSHKREHLRFNKSGLGIRYNYWFPQFGADLRRAGNHPAVFPLSLARDYIISWSSKGDLVIDPFLGSGTTAIACMALGRRFIGFEKNPDYARMASERIASRIRRNSLFPEDMI